MKSALIIFAREPKDGKTKTRLLKYLPVKKVTQIYKQFLKIIFNLAHQISNIEKFIYYAGTGSAIPFLRCFEKEFILKRQIGEDLGERMHRAFIYCSKEKFNKIIVIGSDCITLTEKDILEAFDQLNHYDCVLGPAKDGGYYLIGLKSPEESLFKNMKWSTKDVFIDTIQRLKEKKKTYYLLRQQEDIDTIEILMKYKSYLNDIFT